MLGDLFAPGLFPSFLLSLPTPEHLLLLWRDPMRLPSHPTYLLRMLQHRLKQLATSSPILAATFAQYS
jgi:hypothetical protein